LKTIQQNNKFGNWQVGVNHHTTTPQYSIQRQPSTKNSSIDSMFQHEYFEIILEKGNRLVTLPLLRIAILCRHSCDVLFQSQMVVICSTPA
jgi:hypothetical protein